MANQNLFEALQRVCNFTALESDIHDILRAVEKDKLAPGKYTLLALGEKMREAQKKYFQYAKTGSSEQKSKFLNESKELEKRFDERIIDEKFEQLNLF